MQNASRKAVALVAEMPLEQFSAPENFGLRAATERYIESFGAAALHVSDAVKTKNQHIPWQEIEQLRSQLLHRYMDTSDRLVWNIATEHAPRLLTQIDELLGGRS